jgi:hypothetical protein
MRRCSHGPVGRLWNVNQAAPKVDRPQAGGYNIHVSLNVERLPEFCSS